MQFLQRTLQLIQQTNITKNKLLTDLSLSKNSFVDWENRGTVPNGETLIKIADYFDVSVDYLLGRTDIPAVNKSDPTEYTVLSAASGKAVDSKTVKLTTEQIETMKSIIDKISE